MANLLVHLARGDPLVARLSDQVAAQIFECTVDDWQRCLAALEAAGLATIIGDRSGMAVITFIEEEDRDQRNA